MIERNKSLEALIKQINMMGGKTPPLIAEAMYKVNQRVDKVENAIECDTFKHAANDLYHASMELGFIRKKFIYTFMLGFSVALCFVIILTAILAVNGVLLAVHYG